MITYMLTSTTDSIKQSLIITGIGSIERGCGLVFKCKHGEIWSQNHPEHRHNVLCIHGHETDRDDARIIRGSLRMKCIIALIDAYNTDEERL